MPKKVEETPDMDQLRADARLDVPSTPSDDPAADAMRNHHTADMPYDPEGRAKAREALAKAQGEQEGGLVWPRVVDDADVEEHMRMVQGEEEDLNLSGTHYVVVHNALGNPVDPGNPFYLGSVITEDDFGDHKGQFERLMRVGAIRKATHAEQKAHETRNAHRDQHGYLAGQIPDRALRAGIIPRSYAEQTSGNG